MMKSRFILRTDEIVLSTVTALVIIGLFQQGFSSFMGSREHVMFKQHNKVSKNK